MQARAATDTSVATLQAYYAQVNRLHGIFPINTDHIRIAFTWHDAFRPTKKSTEMDLNFERAGVLFNIGAVKSNIAASADRTSAEGMKLACREFQLAAGLFKHLRCHVVSQLNCSLPSELTEEGLLMVENIMLAQVRVVKGAKENENQGKVSCSFCRFPYTFLLSFHKLLRPKPVFTRSPWLTTGAPAQA